MKWKETEQFRATLQCIKELIGLYRSTIGDFGISENEFWIWYTLIAMTGSYAQQDVCDIWSLSKQTVNTIIARMVQKGLVHLEAMPGAKNRKHIHLTNAGKRWTRRIYVWLSHLAAFFPQSMYGFSSSAFHPLRKSSPLIASAAALWPPPVPQLKIKAFITILPSVFHALLYAYACA